MDEKSFSYAAWCHERGATHAHCPLGCEHPQPGFYGGNTEMICGRCYHERGVRTPVEPCTPATCRD